MFNKSLFIFIMVAFGGVALAQNKGDEDATMKNIAVARDQKVIDEAKNGWWTVSMKNHDERIKWWRNARTQLHNVYAGPKIALRDTLLPIPLDVINANLGKKMENNPGYN